MSYQRRKVLNLDQNLAVTIGGGFFGGILIGYALKKIIKIVAIVAGIFLAVLAYQMHTLNLEAEKAIQYHQQYFMLLGCTEFTKVYLQIKDNPWAYVNFVKLAQNSGIGDGEILKLLEISKDHPSATSKYEKLKADTNLLENEISNLAKDRQRLSDGNENLRKTENQLQLSIKEMQAKIARLDLQRERTENFIKQYQKENVEYNKVKKAIRLEVEDVLGDRRELLRLAIQCIIELLRLDPQKFLSLHYNRSTIHPENDEDLVLVDAEQLYEKMLVNITNKVVTNLSDNMSYQPAFTETRWYGKQASHPNFDTSEKDEGKKKKIADPN